MELYIKYIPLSELKKFPKNPKLHSKELGNSIKEFGFVDPIIIDENTNMIAAGHGRVQELEQMKSAGDNPPDNINIQGAEWTIPVVHGASFKDEKALKKFIVSHNALPAAGGWDKDLLSNILQEVTPFGIDSLVTINLNESPTNIVDFPTLDPIEISPDQDNKNIPEIPERQEGTENYLLEGVFRLEEEVDFLPENDKFAKNCVGEYFYNEQRVSRGPNRYGIPNLDPSKLVEELPPNLKVWGGRQATPDDGKSYYLWNYGAVPEEGVPIGRTLLGFFTHDNFITPWWQDPAFHIAEFIKHSQGSIAIVPDCSIWQGRPGVLQMLSVYKSNWLGRFFQETGKVKIIPRLEFFTHEAQYFSLSGIPFEAPVIATQFHTKFAEESVSRLQQELEQAVRLIKCKQLLVYVSNRGRELINNTNLPCDVLMLDTAKSFRVPKKKIDDPELLELRKRKRTKDPDRVHSPDL